MPSVVLPALNSPRARPPVRRWSTWVVCCAFLLFSGCDQADRTFPQRPIVLVCPWSAGGGSDRVARELAALLEQDLQVPVNVVNATGGGGVTGHTRGAIARPDGYTLTLVTAELNMLHWRGLTNIGPADFEPLALVNRDDAALFVRANAPWHDATELTDAIRQNPGKMKVSGTAFGGIWHIAAAGWLTAAGLNADDLVWISINGSAPSLQELLAGGVDVVCCSVPEAESLLDAGEIRCLAVMADERLPSRRQLPTLAEQGVEWSMGTWRGLAAPRHVPPERLAVLTAAARRVATGDAYRRYMQQAGFEAAYEPPEEFGRFLTATDERFGAIFQSPAFASVHRPDVGPMVFPAVLAGLGCCVAALLLMRRSPAPTERIANTRRGMLYAAAFLAAIAFYGAIAETMGFFLTAAVVLATLTRMLGCRWWTAAALGALVSAGVYQVFAGVLRVPLPYGWFGW